MGVTCLAFLLSWTSSVNQSPASTSPRPAPPHSARLASSLSCIPPALGLLLGHRPRLSLPEALPSEVLEVSPGGSEPTAPLAVRCSPLSFGKLPLIFGCRAAVAWRCVRGIPVLGRGWSQLTCAFSRNKLGFPDSREKRLHNTLLIIFRLIAC